MGRRWFTEHVDLVKKFDVRIAICIYNVLDVINGFVRRIAVRMVLVWDYTTVTTAELYVALA